MSPNDWVTLADHLAWPIAIVILVLIFRKPLISRFRESPLKGEVPGLKFEFGVSEITNEKLSEIDINKVETKVDWSKSGNLFWFPYDVNYTISNIVSGASIDVMLDGLRRVHHHADKLGVGETITDKLKQMIRDMQKAPPSYWSRQKRQEFATELGRIFNTVAQMATDNQRTNHKEGFQPDPKWWPE